MFCDEILSKDVPDRKQFLIDQKLCCNCLSKTHHDKDCISEFTCSLKSCGKKHHTLLHGDEKPMPNSNSSATPNNVNTIQTPPQKKHLQLSTKLKTRHQKIDMSFQKIYQILNGNKSVAVNALFDSRSDCTLLAENVASYLNLNDKNSR